MNKTLLLPETVSTCIFLFRLPCRRCKTCRKRRSLRTNSFFAEFPKTSLGDLLLIIYFWAEDDPQSRTARKLTINKNLVNQIYRRLEDICSVDIYRRPIIPFGGPAHIIMCDESKFNHKAKVCPIFFYFCVPQLLVRRLMLDTGNFNCVGNVVYIVMYPALENNMTILLVFTLTTPPPPYAHKKRIYKYKLLTFVRLSLVSQRKMSQRR